MTAYDVIPLDTIIAWWSISGAMGCLATVSKLLDYRHTARKIKEGGAFNDVMARWCGRLTWASFGGQVTAYGTGIIGARLERQAQDGNCKPLK